MFTLQILDRGQTLLYPLPADAVVLGADDDADFRLHERGVEPRHVRLEPTPDGVRLIALAAVRVNGSPVEECDLQLGDRIEIGDAVIVVGRSVARPAEPDDVLETPRVRVARRAAPKRSRMPLVLLVAAVVLAGLVAFLNSGDEGEVAGEFAAIAIARDKGQLERARRQIARCRADWQGATDDRLERLDAEAAKVDAIEQFALRLEERVLEPGSGSYASWVTELRRLEAAGEKHERIAAHLVRSSLREILERRAALPAPAAMDDPAAANAAPDEQASGADAPAAQPEVDGDAPPPQPPQTPASVIADADRLAGQGLFAQAVALLESQLGEVGDATGVAELQQRLASMRGEALTAMDELIAEAEQQAEAGRYRDAITALSLVQHRFPGGPEFARLAATRRTIEQAAAAAAAAEPRSGAAGVAGRPSPAEPASKPGNGAAEPAADAPGIALSSLRAQLDEIRSKETAGAFAAAAALLREAAEMARGRDPEYAARLERRAAEADRRAAFHDVVAAALAAGQRPTVTLHAGRDVVLESVAGARLVAGGEQLAWSDLSAAGLSALAEQVGASGEAAVGAATMIYAAGDDALAERVLAAVLRADEGMKAVVDRALASGRGEVYDDRGYVLGKDGFVSMRALDVQRAAKKIASRIDGVFRKKDRSARSRFVDELLADGPDALEAVAIAFEQDLDKQIAKLEESQLRKQLDRLATQREVLDKARAHAKELIYDEVRYFYPYKPPAVSSDRYAEYLREQAEVDRRVDTLRRLWRDRRLTVKLPNSLRASLERLGWVTAVLERLGRFGGDRLARVEWARALPAMSSIGVAEYCKTVAEREELEEWERIEAYNKVKGRELTSSVRELLRITNDYRRMFRHRPLALVPEICNAAQSHADEMSRLGYFGHMSPTPGRRTPFERMRLAGYDYGVSENIALGGSAMGAHNSWLRSSGHHRNLLNPNHREMGIGVAGRNWVENFGGGSAHTEDPAYR